MKAKSIVLITNLYGNDKAIAAPDFSDENVKDAICKLIKAKTKNLHCLASSISEGIYSLTGTPHVRQELKPIAGLETKDVLVHVSYAHLHE